MGWKDNLNDIDKPNINISDYQKGVDTPEYIIEKNKELLGSSWINFTSIALFLTSLFYLSKKSPLKSNNNNIVYLILKILYLPTLMMVPGLGLMLALKSFTTLPLMSMAPSRIKRFASDEALITLRALRRSTIQISEFVFSPKSTSLAFV